MIYFRNQVVKFVILMVGRSGSTFLTSALGSHPAIRARGEPLVSLGKQGRAQDQISKANRLLTPWIIGPRKAIGFKTKVLDILDKGAFAELLHEKNVRVISLRRRNTIKWAMSIINFFRLREKTGDMNLRDQSQRLEPAIVKLEQLQKWISYCHEEDNILTNFITQYKFICLPVFYEDLLVDSVTVFNKIFHYLDVSPHSLSSATYKNTNDDLQKAIVNFDELRMHFSDTIYAPMFDEVLLKSEDIPTEVLREL